MSQINKHISPYLPLAQHELRYAQGKSSPYNQQGCRKMITFSFIPFMAGHVDQIERNQCAQIFV